MEVKHWGEVALDKKQLRAVMRAAGNDVKNKTARLISKTAGSGRLYRGGGGSAYRGSYSNTPYRASAPGDPPVRVTGTLANSLKTFVYKSGEGFAVRERIFYALWLESGASGGGKPGRKWRAANRRKAARGVFTQRILLPRPALDKVMQREAPELDRRIGAAVQTGLTWKETKR